MKEVSLQKVKKVGCDQMCPGTCVIRGDHW